MRAPVDKAPDHPVTGNNEILHRRRQVGQCSEEAGPELAIGFTAVADEGVVVPVIGSHESVDQVRVVLVEHLHEGFGKALCRGGHGQTPITS